MTQKITVTLPTQAVAAIRELVTAGKADSVQGFVQHAVRTSLDDVAGWGTLLASALDETGGPMTEAERDWADEVLGRGARPRARSNGGTHQGFVDQGDVGSSEGDSS